MKLILPNSPATFVIQTPHTPSPLPLKILNVVLVSSPSSAALHDQCMPDTSRSECTDHALLGDEIGTTFSIFFQGGPTEIC